MVRWDVLGSPHSGHGLAFVEPGDNEGVLGHTAAQTRSDPTRSFRSSVDANELVGYAPVGVDVGERVSPSRLHALVVESLKADAREVVAPRHRLALSAKH